MNIILFVYSKSGNNNNLPFFKVLHDSVQQKMKENVINNNNTMNNKQKDNNISSKNTKDNNDIKNAIFSNIFKDNKGGKGDKKEIANMLEKIKPKLGISTKKMNKNVYTQL